MNRPFADWAPIYRAKGLWPRPIALGTKASPLKGWQQPDSEFDQDTLNRWLVEYASFGIGLVMGTPLPDGTVLGALDNDRNEYVRLTKTLLRDPPSGRFGAKGGVSFVRVRGDTRYRAFKVKGSGDKIGELLIDRRLCVIPPTIHPDTGNAYRWIGTPLHEIDFGDLPLLEI